MVKNYIFFRALQRLAEPKSSLYFLLSAEASTLLQRIFYFDMETPRWWTHFGGSGFRKTIFWPFRRLGDCHEKSFSIHFPTRQKLP